MGSSGDHLGDDLMPSSALAKFQPFPERLAEKSFNLQTDSFLLWISNTAPAASAAQLSDITQISYTNMSSRALTVSSSAQVSGTYSWIVADLTLTMSGGASPTFRYLGPYDDTATNDELVAGYYDYGVGGVTLADGESLVVDLNAAGIFTLA
jgi:hypothetical protein